MTLIDRHFKDALRDLPEKKLSWQADRRILKMIRKRAAELDGKRPFWMFFQKMVAVPVAFALVLVSTVGYAYSSPSVVKGDMLYPVKEELEVFFYPTDGSSEERVNYHLSLSDKRFAEVQEILERKEEGTSVVAIAYAQDAEDQDPLDVVLEDTLQRATQHMEYAFLVTNEIREVDRVEAVQERIREKLAQQKVMMEKVVPRLKEVKFQRKQKAMSRYLAGLERQEAFQRQREERAQRLLELQQSALENGEVQDVQIEQELDENMIEEEIEVLDQGEAFLSDRVAYHEGLLIRLNKKVEQAKQQGNRVELGLKKELPEDTLMVDRLFGRALAVHYQQEKHILRSEIQALDEEIQKEETEEIKKRGNEEMKEKETNSGVASPFKESEVGRGNEDVGGEEDEVEVESPREAEMESQDSDAGDGESPSDAEVESSDRDEVVQEPIDEDAEREEKEDDDESSEGAEVESQDSDSEEDEESSREAESEEREKAAEKFLEKCEKELEKACEKNELRDCENRAEKLCESLSEGGFERFLEQKKEAFKQERKFQKEQEVKEKVKEKKERIEEIDAKLEKLEAVVPSLIEKNKKDRDEEDRDDRDDRRDEDGDSDRG